ncbi:MAG: carboxypeptidase-like regulatory domain-containing protein, partial [Terriglobales bacterium]
AQASPIALKAGDEMPVNMMLVPTRTYRIRGVITGIVAGETHSLELSTKTGDGVQGAEVGSDGTFEIHGAAPGSYILKAYSTSESSVLTAREDITVAAADVDGVRLVPMPAFTVSGHLRVDAQSLLDLSQFSVNLRVADVGDDGGHFKSDDSFGENAQVDRQGNFSWKNVNPGNYILRLYGGDGHEDFFLKSARVGANDADGTFSLSGPAVFDLVVGTKGATIEGIVTDRDQQGNDAPASNVEVIAVPEEKYRKIPERFGEGATDQFGRFNIRGLAPGAYTLFAWQDVSDDIYRDPDFLKSQEANGTSVKVGEGAHETVSLKLSVVNDDWK